MVVLVTKINNTPPQGKAASAIYQRGFKQSQRMQISVKCSLCTEHSFNFVTPYADV